MKKPQAPQPATHVSSGPFQRQQASSPCRSGYLRRLSLGSLLIPLLSGRPAWADLVPPPTEAPMDSTGVSTVVSTEISTVQAPFAPTWLEWTLFMAINLIIIAIYVVLWYRGSLRKPQNVFQEPTSSKS